MAVSVSRRRRQLRVVSVSIPDSHPTQIAVSVDPIYSCCNLDAGCPETKAILSEMTITLGH
jgi:hypothetical protein